MKRLSIPNLVLAAALALLLPLEQLHCACLGSETRSAPVASHEEHGCCDSQSSTPADHQSHDQQTPHGCVCPEMAPILVPAAGVVVLDASTVAPLAVLAVPAVIAPVLIVSETIPALDVGSSPLPDDPGAHGLRAPPATA
ncbi:MAG: hypothetical protein IT347_03920 [Candidatus Eisenbacteria bacterium]|nr:hypothetical protein [Candidatus Eisenbacteria bacterium]